MSRSLFLRSCAFALILAAAYPHAASSATTAATSSSATAIQSQIDEHNAAITQLDNEIAQYQKQLDATTAKKQTLQSTITQLNTSIKKTDASIKKTQTQISTTQLQIKQLGQSISATQDAIAKEQSGLAQSIRRLNESEQTPLIVSVFTSDTVSEAWQDIDLAQQLNSAINEQIGSLAKQQQTLTDTKDAAKQKQEQYVSQQKTLQAQQGSLTAIKSTQNDLLKQTKSQESTYQQIIAQKKAQQADFEAALSDLKSKLNVIVSPSQITPAGAGILQWPLDKVIITQYFGNTPFAASGAYSGKGHNGIDLGASIGTPLHAALSGVVLGTGNTDSVKGCYSFGKWVMIRHSNGLSTMYAHLSSIGVVPGQNVSTGDVIGYSGETGYATGPHLHFGVYVSSATQIMTLGAATQSKTPCANATMPVTPLAGYLNPLNYLPAK